LPPVRHSLTRRIIALAAAYAVALHALLPAAALAAAEADMLAVICAAERTGAPAQNGLPSHEPLGACGAACTSACASAGLQPDRLAVALDLDGTGSAAAAPRGDRDPRPQRLAHRFQARAPPA
jgi:hypothetical protein